MARINTTHAANYYNETETITAARRQHTIVEFFSSPEDVFNGGVKKESEKEKRNCYLS